MIVHSFIEDFVADARDAERSEAAFRREAAATITALEQARAFAFRRVNLMKSLVDTIVGADSEEAAVASAQAMLADRLGWTSESEARDEVLTQFAPVARAVFVTLAPEAEKDMADIRGALTAFEDWFAQARQKPFWVLFEHYIPETPRVDF